MATVAINEESCNAALPSQGGVHLSTVAVQLTGPLGAVKTFALLDTGSSRSFVTDEIIAQVGSDSSELAYSVCTIAGPHNKTGRTPRS